MKKKKKIALSAYEREMCERARFECEVDRFMRAHPDAEKNRILMADLLSDGYVMNLKGAYLVAQVIKAIE